MTVRTSLYSTHQLSFLVSKLLRTSELSQLLSTKKEKKKLSQLLKIRTVHSFSTFLIHMLFFFSYIENQNTYTLTRTPISQPVKVEAGTACFFYCYFSKMICKPIQGACLHSMKKKINFPRIHANLTFSEIFPWHAKSWQLKSLLLRILVQGEV